MTFCRFFSTGRLKELNKLPCLSCLPGAPRASPQQLPWPWGGQGWWGEGLWVPQESKVRGTSGSGRVGTGPQEASSLSSQTVPPLPRGRGGQETHLCAGLCSSPLGRMEATEAQSSDGQESGWGGEIAVNLRLQKGRAATEHGRDGRGTTSSQLTPISVRPPTPSPCLLSPTVCVLGPSQSGSW